MCPHISVFRYMGHSRKHDIPLFTVAAQLIGKQHGELNNMVWWIEQKHVPDKSKCQSSFIAGGCTLGPCVVLLVD